jgi:dihydropteroate synthase
VSSRPPIEERFSRPSVMGVLNVTPDSFSDGGLYLDPALAIAHGVQLAEEGADVLDVGGESTRPGSDTVPAGIELERVLPVIEGLREAGAASVSIDTMKAEVAARALEAGASFVNDVTALRHDPDMAGVIADAGVPVCLMHMLGTPKTMQQDPRYGDVVAEVSEFLLERAAAAEAAGVAHDLICLDPGIGFGKTLDHNLELLAHLDRLAGLGYPLLIAVSRKRFLGAITGRNEADRLAATIAANVAALERGAWMFRVHDVRPNREALDVSARIRAAW